MKERLDTAMVRRGLVPSRSQAESWIKLGHVSVDGKPVLKPGFFVSDAANIQLQAEEQYVSRAGLKLASAAAALKLDFTGAIVLDVGSSTGGFTDYALRHGAKKVIAVDVGTDQLHPSLRADKRIELHEKTDIRQFIPIELPDIVVIDVSFISLRDVLPHIAAICRPHTRIAAMIKPQFEAGKQQVSRGIIKNDRLRRTILLQFESWAKNYFVISTKADSQVAGAGGNRERFYLLQKFTK